MWRSKRPRPQICMSAHKVRARASKSRPCTAGKRDERRDSPDATVPAFESAERAIHASSETKTPTGPTTSLRHRSGQLHVYRASPNRANPNPRMRKAQPARPRWHRTDPSRVPASTTRVCDLLVQQHLRRTCAVPPRAQNWPMCTAGRIGTSEWYQVCLRHIGKDAPSVVRSRGTSSIRALASNGREALRQSPQRELKLRSHFCAKCPLKTPGRPMG